MKCRDGLPQVQAIEPQFYKALLNGLGPRVCISLAAASSNSTMGDPRLSSEGLPKQFDRKAALPLASLQRLFGESRLGQR